MRARAAIVLAGLLAATGAGASEIQWGINGHPITAYPGIGIGEQLDLVNDLGMTSYRVNVPDGGSVKILEELVAEGKRRGIEILPVLTPSDIDLETDSVEQLYAKSNALAVALATRFKDDIRVWELGNEMENYAIIQPCELRDDGTEYPCDWGPAGGVGPLDYYGPRWEKVSAVLKGLSDGIAAVDPDLRKAIGTAGWGHLGAFERLQNDGVPWDISVWHSYGQDPAWAFEHLAAYGKPIWLTEFNHPYGSQKGLEAQAEGLALAMRRLNELKDTYAVEAAHIYELLDEDYWAPSFEAEMGLVTLEGQDDGGWKIGEPKPAYQVVRSLIRSERSLRACELPAEIGDGLSQEKAAYAYCLILGRDGDSEGLASWTAALDKGDADVRQMLLAMLQSDEFIGRHATMSSYRPRLCRLPLQAAARPRGRSGGA